MVSCVKVKVGSSNKCFIPLKVIRDILYHISSYDCIQIYSVIYWSFPIRKYKFTVYQYVKKKIMQAECKRTKTNKYLWKQMPASLLVLAILTANIRLLK